MLAFAQPTPGVWANGNLELAPRLATAGHFPAPVGFLMFCLSHKASCVGGGASEVRLTGEVMDRLGSINARVNSTIRPSPERVDTWVLGAAHGDCEDYVLAKRAALIAAGLPASALRIAAVTTGSGIGHAVLVVRTDQGDLVLDNLTPAIRRWNETSLRWVAMTLADGRSWARIV